METLYSEQINKIRQNKRKLEKILKVKITFSGKNINIEGSAVDKYVSLQVIEAINLGFTTDQAILLRDEEFVFEKINIKDLTKRHDLEIIRGRIIGTHGRTKKTIR